MNQPDNFGPRDFVIVTRDGIIRLSPSNRDEIRASDDFAKTRGSCTTLVLSSNPRTGMYQRDPDGTIMLDVSAQWNRMQRRKYPDTYR